MGVTTSMCRREQKPINNEARKNPTGVEGNFSFSFTVNKELA